MTKKIVLLALTFEEVEDEDGNPELEPSETYLYMSELTKSELSALGEEIAQTDRWQVDNWIAIQAVLGGDSPREDLR
jgi:hypothetical protein